MSNLQKLFRSIIAVNVIKMTFAIKLLYLIALIILNLSFKSFRTVMS